MGQPNAQIQSQKWWVRVRREENHWDHTNGENGGNLELPIPQTRGHEESPKQTE